MAPLLEGISGAVLGRPMPVGGWVLYSALTSVIIFVGALTFFKRTEPYFAESV
jgi:ABC-type polysaccharide/polyol phosphate export permease